MSEIRSIRAVDVDPEPVEWLLSEPPIPRRGISIICGFRGVTKTTAACWLAAQITAGGHEVFFASQEDDVPSLVRPRMEAAGADLERVRFPDEDDEPLRFPADAERLARYVNERDTALVILDPLSAFIPGFTSPTAARDALTPLTRISRQHNCAMLFIHHFRKSGGKTAWDAMGGSGALSDVARAIYVYGDKPEPDPIALLFGMGTMFLPKESEEDVEQPNVRVLANLKLSADAKPPGLLFEFETVDASMPVPVPRVRLLGETNVDGETLFAGWMKMRRLDEEGEHGISQAATFLLHFLVDGAQTTKSLNAAAKDAGITQRTLERARNRLKILTFQREKHWWVQLPELPDSPPEDWS